MRGIAKAGLPGGADMADAHYERGFASRPFTTVEEAMEWLRAVSADQAASDRALFRGSGS